LPTTVHAGDDVVAPADLSAQEIANAITELDVQRAHLALSSIDAATPSLSYQRARLSIYVGDCDSAEAILQTLPETPESGMLLDLSRKCAKATAGSLVVEDKERGVWIRLQDAADEALVPLIVDVAVRARQTMIDDLGIALPLPIRIDLVRDLFSLAAVSGLPLEAAETTGTVAVARWGRVTLLSPRAATLGYPWQDTLAHEITHLALSRGSRDYAPLWLQEGIAKREEVRWRPERPMDEDRDPHAIAREALLTGRSIGIDKIGPSIAMLPSADDARISYAEVESFMDFWIKDNGREAFTLLMVDLKGLGTRDTDEAMISITGFPLKFWIARWQQHLRSLPAPAQEEADVEDGSGAVVQSVRLGDLLAKQARLSHASAYFERAVEQAPDVPAVRFRSAATKLSLGQKEAASEQLGSLAGLSRLHGGWLGLHGRRLHEQRETDRALESLSLAVAIDPYGEEAACEGHGVRTASGQADALALPADPIRRRLCEAARRIVRD
jgi:tetratricopeptide (TPR) repeat protein